MATVVGVLAPPGISASHHSHSTPVAESKAEAHPAPARARPISALGDIVFVSRASTLLSAVEQLLKKTPATSVNQVLSSAASDILAQAQVENDPTQARVLENLATRLQVAASSGSSLLPPYTLASLLG